VVVGLRAAGPETKLAVGARMPRSVDRRRALKSLASLFLSSPLLRAADRAADEAAIEELINVFGFRDLAKSKLDPLAWDYMAEGGKDEVSLRDNRLAFRDLIIRPRILVDVHEIDVTTEFLGRKMDLPIFVCPAGGKGCFYPNGEEEAARGAAAMNAMFITNGGIEDYLTSGKGPEHWWQYTTGGQFRTRSTMLNFVEQLEDSGCTGICFTVDNMLVSHRERSIRNGFARSWCGSLEGEIPRDEEDNLVYGPNDRPWRTDVYPKRPFPTPAWETVRRLRDATNLKIMLKGVLTAEDTAKAAEYGMDAVVVSNHGARQLDHTGATIEALPECVEAAAGKIAVLVDGGFRRGTDVLKALALGATAVGVARPYLWGLTCFGREGVARVLELLKVELALDMGMAGAARIADIDRKLVRFRD